MFEGLSAQLGAVTRGLGARGSYWRNRTEALPFSLLDCAH